MNDVNMSLSIKSPMLFSITQKISKKNPYHANSRGFGVLATLGLETLRNICTRKGVGASGDLEKESLWQAISICTHCLEYRTSHPPQRKYLVTTRQNLEFRRRFTTQATQAHNQQSTHIPCITHRF